MEESKSTTLHKPAGQTSTVKPIHSVGFEAQDKVKVKLEARRRHEAGTRKDTQFRSKCLQTKKAKKPFIIC